MSIGAAGEEGHRERCTEPAGPTPPAAGEGAVRGGPPAEAGLQGVQFSGPVLMRITGLPGGGSLGRDPPFPAGFQEALLLLVPCHTLRSRTSGHRLSPHEAMDSDQTH